MKPELGQRREKDGEIPSAVGGKKSGYVLNEDEAASGENKVSNPCELEEEAGSLAGEPSSSPCDGEVLTREAPADEVNTARRSAVSLSVGDSPSVTFEPFDRVWLNFTHVVEARDSGPVPSQHGSPVGIGLALPQDGHARPFKSEVEAADSAEERPGIHRSPP